MLHYILLQLGSAAVVCFVALYAVLDASLTWQRTAIDAILLSRALRRAWQAPDAAVLETAVVAWFRWGGLWPDVANVATLTMQMLIVGLSHDRAQLLWATLQFQAVHLVSTLVWILFFSSVFFFIHPLFLRVLRSWFPDMPPQRAKKQRPRVAALVVSVLWAPLSFASALVAAGLAAPCVPFLGLPVFIPGYPRPKWHWPQGMDSPSSCVVIWAPYLCVLPLLRDVCVMM